MTYTIKADAETAKRTGGMLALIPHIDDAQWHSVPGGEPVDDLHCTLFYFGEDVTDVDPSELVRRLDEYFDGYGPGFPVIYARTFGHALFNPDGANDRDPCAVYLIGDSKNIVPLRDDLLNIIYQWAAGAELPEQHEPYHPHVTAGYGLELDELQDPSQITFDVVALEWAGQSYHFLLVD